MLVSRQYVDMSRIRIEGLLAAFPKLVGSGKQHTYVETENVRYIYQPMEVRPFWRRRRDELCQSVSFWLCSPMHLSAGVFGAAMKPNT